MNFGRAHLNCYGHCYGDCYGASGENTGTTGDDRGTRQRPLCWGQTEVSI